MSFAYQEFERGLFLTEGVLRWHNAMSGALPVGVSDEELLSRLRRGDGRKGLWAEARRIACSDGAESVDAMLCSEPFALFIERVLPNEGDRVRILANEGKLAGLARAAVALTAVKTIDLRASFGSQMAADKGNGQPMASRDVARGVFETDDPDEVLPRVLAVVDLLDGRVNAVDLARGLYGWPSARKKWAMPYYGVVTARDDQKQRAAQAQNT